MSDGSLRTQVLSGLRWTAGARLVSQLFTWAMTLLVIRLLAPADYGLLAMANVFVAFLMLMSEIGLGLSIVQADKVDRQQLRQVFGLVISANALLFVLLVATAPLIASFFDEPRLAKVIWALALQFPLVALISLPRSLLERAMNFRTASVLEAASAVVSGVVVLVLAYTGHGVWSLVWGSLAGTALRAAGFMWLSPMHVSPSFSLAGMRHFVSFGGQVTLARMLWFFYSQMDTFLVGKLLGKEPLGVYSVSMHLAGLPVQRISSVLNQVAMPAFSRLQGDPDAAGAHFMTAARLMALLSFPISFAMSALAPELVAILMGDQWHSAVMPLQLLCLLMPLRMLSSMVPAAVQGMGHPKISVLNQLSACIVMPIAFVIGSHWGLFGVSMAWLIAFPLVLLGNLIRALPVLNLRVWQLASSQLPATVCATALWVASTALHPLIEQWPAFVRLCLLGAAGVAVYLLGTLLINRAGAVEAWQMLRKRK
ncbi:lipopolysaccharide biosynthesis protein [Paucibacter sp. APW11]|uniref:Lipopolysaccharide biosynthesis protein n=1 Tax=Roseateles aquae TaxID=3077235 RepID=A0ABU3P5T2_9BURK|nr:lipopolysaccharide biosynthesis protein [Paucibacter sp. APW11]MDT8997930.1 lipopolysaccharide biosynthesis protein [Paucibacter sp. APW11]